MSERHIYMCRASMYTIYTYIYICKYTYVCVYVYMRYVYTHTNPHALNGSLELIRLCSGLKAARMPLGGHPAGKTPPRRAHQAPVPEPWQKTSSVFDFVKSLSVSLFPPLSLSVYLMCVRVCVFVSGRGDCHRWSR